MAAQQRNLDTIADNLANAGVVGFKGSAQRFAELIAPDGGLGTISLGPQVFLAQGKLARSGGPLDLAIDGPGFFAVTDAHGRRFYTRDGAFSRAADGTVQNAQGLRLAGTADPQRRALDHRRRGRQRPSDVRQSNAHDRYDSHCGVSGAGSFEEHRRHALRGDRRLRNAASGARRNARWSEAALRYARAVERHDYRCHDADSHRAACL